LAAGLCPDPLRELTALPKPSSWIRGKGWKGIKGGKWRESKGKIREK